ncbi:DUF4209 domain-containing protein [Microbacterium sp.]|uniref:DUF4209 domain-containing protein n=1 Tax=Microbacterium sp. TaxID=51671 RepID=UPI0028116611|nr:DUF4209 domain-containing protein [Microbacterium sp.]
MDPDWWVDVIGQDDEGAAAELVSLDLKPYLDAAEAADTDQFEFLRALSIATSAMLNPESWAEPFRPMAATGEWRSPLPSDLDDDQLALLAAAAPLVEHRAVRARLADVAWTYGRRDDALMQLAIDSYRSAALAPEHWFSVGREAWQRGLALAGRRGKRDAASRQMSEALRDAVLDAGQTDISFTLSCSELLRQHGRALDRPEEIGAHLRSRADATEAPALARALMREATEWMPRGSDDALIGRWQVGRLYVAEADAWIAVDRGNGLLTSGHLLENAIATLLALPRRFRSSHAIDDEIKALRSRLEVSRYHVIDSMREFTSEPVDLAPAAAAVQASLVGLDLRAALRALAGLPALPNVSRLRQSAATVVDRSVAWRIASRVTYSSDGRILRRRGSGADDREEEIERGLAQLLVQHAQVMTSAFILPALQVVSTEHLITRQRIMSWCVESPVAPIGHEGLWAAGLHFGFEWDFGPAAAVLVPQLEQFVRLLAKSRGAHTIVVDELTGSETEKSFGALLDTPEILAEFGEEVCNTLRYLLLDRGGSNLRNHLAHGIASDNEAGGPVACFLWWFCLRLVLHPLLREPESSDGTRAE